MWEEGGASLSLPRSALSPARSLLAGLAPFLCPPPPFPTPHPCLRQWTGHQQRTVPLPMWADESALKVTAFEHGVMTIQAPRRAGSAPFPQPRRLSFA